ncbi:dihydrofolate reductase [Roseibium algae]|uniref:Dihydrofolate reductase n=1 Tax=Roseibium algae TaxID=3123038 RepID=A0ABU8TKQ2_9HYPH
MSEIFLVAAVARNGIIGADNDMPWHISSDLKHFKALTAGTPMIMGRRTFQSLPGILPGRPHIVITRDPEFQAEGATVVGSLEVGLELAERLAGDLGSDGVAIIGGGQIYTMGLSLADRLEITEVQADPEGDAHFPEIDPSIWQEVSRVSGERSERDSAGFEFVTYRRRAA